MKKILLTAMLLIFGSINSLGQNYGNILNSQLNYEWNFISEVPGGMNVIYFIDSKNGWVIGDSGKIFMTEDGGEKWLPQNSGTTNRLESIYFLDDKTGFTSGFNRTLIYTNDKGNTWIPVQVASDTGSIYSSISSDADNYLYFITNYGEIYCSNDSGKSWFNKYNFNGWGFSYIDYSNKPVCFAKLYGIGVLYKSTDGGDNWEKLIMIPQFTGDFYFLNSDIGWVTESWVPSSSIHDSASIYITADGGETWTRQSTLEGKSVNNIVFVDTLKGWASSYFPRNKIYYTSDGGQSWICQFEPDSSEFITDIFFLDKSNGWALTNQGKIIKYGVPVEVSVEKPDNIYIDDYFISQNYPNPFNPSTKIKFTVPNVGTRHAVSLRIYDVLGREVATLVNEEKPAGVYEVEFQSVVDGKQLASSVYFYQLKAGEFVKTRKMVLMK